MKTKLFAEVITSLALVSMILVGTKIRWKIATLDSIRDLDSSY
jgi:hypothetical protein